MMSLPIQASILRYSQTVIKMRLQVRCIPNSVILCGTLDMRVLRVYIVGRIKCV